MLTHTHTKKQTNKQNNIPVKREPNDESELIEKMEKKKLSQHI